MEALAVLLGLFALALPIAVVVLIVLHAQLRRKVTALEARTEALAQALRQPAEHDAPQPSAPDATAPPPPGAAMTAAAPTATTPWKDPVEAAPQTAPDPRPARPSKALPPEPGGPSLPEQLAAWLRDNWFYAVAAVSLALAGVFLVQYGVETGLLTPPARVAAALVFGAALIVAGEQIRRRFGDDASVSTAYLPSTLSSAGLVSLMGGVLAARLLYDLIPPGPALAALFAVTLFALWLGWRHGPLLAAIGLTGGMAAPFLVGGSSDTPEWLLVYFTLLTAMGLGIDTLRRWAWVSVLSLVLGFGTGALLVAGLPTEGLVAAAGLYAAILALMAILIPARSLRPDHAGPAIAEAAFSSDTLQPIFPVWLAGGATLAASLGLLAAAGHPATGETALWLMLCLATGLAVILILWSNRAPGLQDLAALPALSALALIAVPDLSAPLRDALATRVSAEATLTETRLPLDITLALLPGLALTLAAAVRSLQGAPYAAVWAGVAALAAPVTGLVLELTWQPAQSIGAWPWALHAIALAGLMTALATRFAARDTDRLRAALATLSALACVAFALTLILTDAALTLALAATVVAAAMLDRRFDLAPLSGFLTAGVIALGFRLLGDPGLLWATQAPFPEMLAVYAGSLAALLTARALIASRTRHRAEVILESAAWSVGGVTLSMVLYHVIEALTGHASGGEHWVIGLHATVWIGAALAQLQRLPLGGALKLLRIGLGAAFGLLAVGLVTVSLSFANPLFTDQTVRGVAILNTLGAAYLLPALVLMLGAWRLRQTHRALRVALAATGGTLTAIWTGLAIRHLWQGETGMQVTRGITQPELYSYTVALLLTGAVLFYLALARRNDRLRLAGVGVIALAVAKVFLIDISGLDGLARVFSFLLLGLSLAGLAWLNRWVQTRAMRTPGAQGPAP